MYSDFPKLLIINGTPIGDQSGTGITLANIFSNWPSQRILQLCYHYGDERNQGEFTYIIFPPQTAYIDHIARRFFRTSKLDERFNKDTKGMNAGIVRPTVKGILHDAVRAMLDDSPIRIPTAIVKVVDNFQPEALYSNLATMRIMKTVLYFAQRYDIKIVAHFMDDWPSTIYTTSVLSRWANKKVDRQIRRCLSRSVCSLGISEYMAEVYEKRYGVQFTWACNPIQILAQPYLPPDGDNIVFTYSGGLHLNRWKSLETVAEALEKLNQQGRRTLLDIYTSEEHRLAFQPQMKPLSVINWKGSIRPEQVPEVLKASTVLVHVESFDENIVNYARYSFSTKLSEYLASGRPILAYAPLDIASTRYLEKYGVGLVANTPQTLCDRLRQLVSNAGLRRDIGTRGLEFAKQHHKTETVQERVLAVLKANVTESE